MEREPAEYGPERMVSLLLAAVPLGDSNTLITNTQFQWSGTTWSGDVVINSSNPFSIGGAGGTVDLYTAMLNEAGNVLGVLDSHTDDCDTQIEREVRVAPDLE